jgi:4-hydroxybenzoate polyprenyltransferase
MPGSASIKAAAPEPAERSLVRALVTSLRPSQWVKNAALLAAPIFAQRITHPESLAPMLLGILAFCLLASAVYLANDIVDREADRLHPEKRRRPIAAGNLPVSVAAGSSALLALTGLALSAVVGERFLIVAVAYLGLQVVYTAVLKNMVVVDVFAIASGFVLRVVAGAEAIAVPVSNWLYLCTLLLALFLALAKRRAELLLLKGDAIHHRRILAEYTTPMVDQLITVLSSCTVLAYSFYTLSPETIQKFGTDRLKFTVPFVLFGLFRYTYLVHKHGGGEQPEQVLLFDRPMQLNLVAYLATVAWAIYR